MLLSQIPVEIEYRQVLRYLGEPGTQEFPLKELEKRIREIISLGRALIHPTAAFSTMTAANFKELNGCTGVSVIAVTAGKILDEQVEKYSRAGETTSAVVLDAVGTVAVEQAAKWVVNLTARQQGLRGLYPTPRYAPGCGGFELHHLPELLSLAHGSRVGITYNDYYQMTPIKSLVFMIGWSTVKYELEARCNFCRKSNCQYRITCMEGDGDVVL